MKPDPDRIRSFVDRTVGEIGSGAGDVIPLLHAVQKEFHYLPEEALRRICEATDITPAAVTGVSTFYSQFRHAPVGEHIIRVCTGTACHVKGSERVYDAFRRELRIGEGSDTDPETRFTVQKIACLGCCTIAPVVQIDDVTYGHVKPAGVAGILDDFLLHKNRATTDGDGRRTYQDEAGEIRIGLGSCCVASGSRQVKEALEKSLEETGIRTRVKRVGCVGMCHRTPLLEVSPPGEEPVLYDRVRPEDVRGIILRHFRPASLRSRLKNSMMSLVGRVLDEAPADGFSRHPLHVRDKPIQTFLGRQIHITTEHSGRSDPLDLEDYRAKGGFAALESVLGSYSPEDVIGQVEASGLRGRGGAGFPTGAKWRIVRGSVGDGKYVICNGDEGDPGAFMDRMILESYPFRVIEGMAIAAYAVGAHEALFYIRAEYPLALERVRNALSQCRDAGLVGEDVLEKGFSLSFGILEGAGAFVCGEETALIASMQGERGNPRFRPPYPAEHGLWGRPTLVNNCETFATVPWIVRNGPEALAALGTGRSRGTKVFSLAGKVARGGLIEVPMGITIREIVEDIGGGIDNGRAFKAVQVGGPSGGCIPARLADTKVDYEDLTRAGAMMGSGGLLIMDDSDCMVDIARYFLSFTQNQSCGKCTYCRIGTKHMLGILEDLCAGKGRSGDLKKLEDIARKTKRGSLCGLGKTAPNPVLTTLAYFREEYEAHIGGKCPAKRCKDLITYWIDTTCIGCTVCAQKCPVGAIEIAPYKRHFIDQDKCTKCDTCRQSCPTESVKIQ